MDQVKCLMLQVKQDFLGLPPQLKLDFLGLPPLYDVILSMVINCTESCYLNVHLFYLSICMYGALADSQWPLV